MPHFGAMNDFQRHADDYYKFMNSNHFADSGIQWDEFCTEDCTGWRKGYGRASTKRILLDGVVRPTAWCKEQVGNVSFCGLC